MVVAFMNEAVNLRKSGINCPIMILGWTSVEDYVLALEHDIILTMYNLEEAQKLNEIAKSLGKKATIHLKVDTGMTRIGLVLRRRVWRLLPRLYLWSILM